LTSIDDRNQKQLIQVLLHHNDYHHSYLQGQPGSEHYLLLHWMNWEPAAKPTILQTPYHPWRRHWNVPTPTFFQDYPLPYHSYDCQISAVVKMLDAIGEICKSLMEIILERMQLTDIFSYI